MLEEVKRKIMEGNMSVEEWDALDRADREKALVQALLDAIASSTTTTPGAENRLAAGALFADEEKPTEGTEMLLPEGYALAPSGVYYAKVQQEKKTFTVKLTSTPFFISARDVTGRVRLLVFLQGQWRGEWIQASRLTAARLADWFIFPEPGAREKELVSYARACVAVAPFVTAGDIVAQAAVEVLMRLFPVRAAGVEFPALRAFAQIRELAGELGVDPLAVRGWYARQGFILDGNGKVVRQGKTTARMLAFTSRVKEFLENLRDGDDAEQGKEGKVFRVRFLSGPDKDQERLVALPGATVVPLGAETPTALSPLAQALAGKHWVGEVVDVKAKEPYQIQILEIDPPTPGPAAQQQEQAQVS